MLRIFIILLLLPFSLLAQVHYDFSSIDHQLKNAPKIKNADLSPLYEYFSEKSKNELESVRAIYHWIRLNISYDEKAYNDGNRRINRTNTDIINRRKAICWGYANLFQEMARAMGIESIIISGYARTQLSQKYDLEEINHAWNAVKVDGYWHLLDVTWDSSLLGKKDEFALKYERDYFLTAPQYFILTHLPANPIWQLLNCPISAQQAQLPIDSLHSSITDYQCNTSKDTLANFLKLNTEERRFQEALATYNFNPTANNKHHLGNAFIDYHNYLDEQLVSLQETNQIDSILILQAEMIDCCEQAASMTKLLDKQQENCAYNYLNYAIALLSEHPKEEEKKKALEQVEIARNMLEKLPSNFLIQQGLKRCEEVIEYINP
ncbi:MAG: transglutaminase domain-containing protein [Bacteroidota bacterium]